MPTAVEQQKAYYADTALRYDDMHEEPEHLVALQLVAAFVELRNIRSILDVGAGTGRAMGWLKQRFPDLKVKGVEPVEELRKQAYAKGVSPQDLVAGDGYALPFESKSFDLVCEFAVLHHVERPNQVAAEMSRVASRMLCISDCNFMGQGQGWLRVVKYLVFQTGLWPAANWVKTRGRGYTYSEGDGIAYSYSVYQSLKTLRQYWNDIRLIRTSADADRQRIMMLSAGHILVIAEQRDVERSKQARPL